MRTGTGIRRLPPVPDRPGLAGDGSQQAEPPWRLSTRRNRRTRPEARPLEDVEEDPILLGRRRPGRREDLRERGYGLGRPSSSASSSSRDRARLLGRVNEGLGISAGEGGPRRPRAGPSALRRSGRRRSCVRCLPCPFGAGRGGQLQDGRLEQTAMIVVAELLGEHPAGDRDGHVGRLLPDLGQGLVARRGDVALGPLRAASASSWACLTICSAVAWASCRALRGWPDLVRRPGPSAGGARPAVARSRCAPLGLQGATCSRCPSRSCKASESGFQANSPQDAEAGRERPPASRWPGWARGFSGLDLPAHPRRHAPRRQPRGRVPARP